MVLLLIVLLIIGVSMLMLSLLLARAIINEKNDTIDAQEKIIKALMDQMNYNS